MTKSETLRLIRAVVTELLGDGSDESKLPVYCPHLMSEAQTNAEGATLPLIYIWNEHQTSAGLAFSFSVNGHIVGAALKKRLPRGNPQFVAIRDTIMEGIRHGQDQAIHEVVAKLRNPPSQIYPCLIRQT